MIRSHLRAVMIAMTLLAVPGTGAWTAGTALAQTQQEGAELDALFDALKNTTTETDAAVISAQIWHIWMNPDDPDLAEMMLEARSARIALDISRSMAVLNRIVDRYPDYAEGWNRRATLNFELGNYQASLRDIDATLEREPRHYGAISGQALVYLALGEKGKARQAINRALEIHPFIAEHPPLSDLVEPTVNI